MSVHFLHAPSVALARATTAEHDVVLTVEAEYGQIVIEGSLYTAAHHQAEGQYMGRHLEGGHAPSPCNDPKIPQIVSGNVLVSHVDLDTFGGCLRALPEYAGLFKTTHAGFWGLAEFVDVRGAHKLWQANATPGDLDSLYAFWAWNKTLHRLSRDTITEITSTVHTAGDTLQAILTRTGSGEKWIAAGRANEAAEHELNRRTFSRREGDIIVRIASDRDFCNHLYGDSTGEPALAVASYNKDTGSVTISLADPIPGVSCCQIVQYLWGPEAGGHAGIAGSPRERHMSHEDFEQAITTLFVALAHR